MKLKVFCQPFVIPYLEAKGFTRNLDDCEPNIFSQKIIELLSENNTVIATKKNKIHNSNGNRYNYAQYTSSVELTINDDLLPKKIYTSILIQGYATIKFSKYIKSLIYNEFVLLMLEKHINQKESITQVLDHFYSRFVLEVSMISPETLRKHWTRNKNEFIRIHANQIL